MKNADYWQRRFDNIEELKTATGENAVHNMERIFTNAQRDLENQISGWYNRFATNNQIDLAEARRLLNSNELEEFRWTVDEYISYAKQNTVSKQWVRQLENASARYHISRLEALKLQTQNTMERLFGNQLDGIDSLMKRQFLDGYHHAIFEVQSGFSVGWDIAGIPESQLETLMNKPWMLDGRTFSDRIWADKQRLVNEVHTQLTQGLITGTPPNVLIDNLARSMNTSKNNAARLIMTESTAISAVGHEAAYRELDVEQVRILETLDAKTCSCCEKLDGKVIRLAEYQVGVTVPPFHPWCRGTTVPHFDDNYGERAARDKDGKTYYVPNDMEYPEWKETFVDGTREPRTKPLLDGWRGLDYNAKYSKNEAIERLKSAFGIDFSDSRKYPINELLLADMVGWMDSFGSYFPSFMEKNPVKIPLLNIMPPSGIGKNTLGHYMRHLHVPKASEIALNGSHHSNMTHFDSVLNRTKGNGWAVANANRKGVFVHEYGHHVSNSMRWITGNQRWQEEFMLDVINDFRQANPNLNVRTFKDLGNHVSRYAATSYNELFAEAFAEYFGGENPRDFALTFGRKLETALKGVR